MREAKVALRDALARVDEGQPGVDRAVTFEAWARHWREQVLPDARRHGRTGRGRPLAPGSIRAYSMAVSNHAVPALGRLQLGAVTALDVQGVLDKMQARGLSPAYQNMVHKSLSRLFGDAKRARLIARDPMSEVTPPERRTVRTKVVPTREHVHELITSASDPRTRVLIALMSYTGCRIGEALSASWSGYDVDAGTLAIDGKTGPRTVVVTPSLARELSTWRAVQATERLRSIWWGDADLIVSTECGTVWDSSNARRRFRVVADKVCPGAVPHSLRHAAATILLEEGVDVRTVADLLGHSSTKTTQDTYQHVTRRLQSGAVDALERAIVGE